jgi:predicted DNA-binding transcriptional regulator YafY
MLNYARRYDPNTASIFTKLNSIVPEPLREEIQKTLDWMQKQPKNEKYLSTLSTLVEAWLSRSQVKISYWNLEADKAAERIIDPYFIEPSAISHSVYVIAYCHSTGKLLRFKIERIEAIEVTSLPYVIPPDFDASAYFGSSWGIVVEDEVKTIRLKFVAELARIMVETKYHPSQMVKRQHDGSLIMTLRVGNTVELYSWIMGWGEKVEVLEPKELRREIVRSAKAILGVYNEK